MRKYSVLAFFSLCALSVFWACGDGEFVGASNDDILAIERYEKKFSEGEITADEIADVMGKCGGDKKCIEETKKNLQIVDAPDTTKKDSSASSSSAADTTKKDSLLSSSATADTTAKDSTASDSTASSASADTSAVSSSAAADSSVSSSSVVAGSSSSAAASSSSRSGHGSSSSAGDKSSSSAVPASSATVDPGQEDLKIDGVCESNFEEGKAPLGEIVWTYYPKAGSRSQGMFEWESTKADDATYKQSGTNLTSVTMNYVNTKLIGGNVSATVTFDGTVVQCSDVRIIEPESSSSEEASAESSSSEEKSSGSTAVKSSNSGSTGCGTIPMIGGGSGGCPSSSSEVQTPASSSEAASSSSSVAPVVSSSSEGGSSSSLATYAINPSAPVTEIPQDKIKIPSGKCFSVSFNWENSGWAPSEVHAFCYARGNGKVKLTVSYGEASSTATGDWYASLQGDPVLLGPVNFGENKFENICVTVESAELAECGLN